MTPPILRTRARATAVALVASVILVGAALAAEHARDNVVTAAELRHADPELEALLPTSLGGIALTVESQAGTDLSTRSAPFDTFLEGLGKGRADFTLASAYARGGDLKAEVGAWRVDGADTAMLLPAFKAVMQASSTTPLTIVEQTIAGRDVIRIGDPGQLTRGPLYVMVRGETLLFVQTPEPSLAEEAMSKLPQ